MQLKRTSQCTIRTPPPILPASSLHFKVPKCPRFFVSYPLLPSSLRHSTINFTFVRASFPDLASTTTTTSIAHTSRDFKVNHKHTETDRARSPKSAAESFAQTPRLPPDPKKRWPCPYLQPPKPKQTRPNTRRQLYKTPPNFGTPPKCMTSTSLTTSALQTRIRCPRPKSCECDAHPSIVSDWKA